MMSNRQDTENKHCIVEYRESERMQICGTYNAEYYAKGGLMPSYKLGWNKCLDAIEGDADKTDD